MSSEKIIRSTWFLATFFLFFFGICWGSFQWVYKNEILLQSLFKSTASPDAEKVMMLYNAMIKKVPSQQDIGSYYCLGKILTRAGKRKETVKVLNTMIKITPEDMNIRLWLAIELHNQQRYREAEKHFVVLLRKSSKDSLRKYPEYH
ncbi:MAG: hypothetical protein DCC43_05540 [Candidatus Brocadia sp.]|jgi:thioredoxin-like negative regulator of GroEL|uniref:Uncharacterized protein n=1 Tax=Candidatus Brocadia fulgida TaxID=380242 RepID=A0A0M2UUR4_9BACT|nr:MAG: hypothetical protein BROFUL_02563 [Candidatus Brocadia fulgida]MCC6325527.1 hypothetical protein [Candidatus Brocadia sp.]MCE7911399.1 hypothetical protein [Candidatus Brocadia sp. AMX3]OQY99121.1 MAG: hypothetical protein B6D35_10175 [Candidatus Brocadia sp. UTAMX2]MBV6517838.1 hypothetical protein [Candidatus Brocadia fulgida]